MELSDFAIGETFWTHVGAFRCTDVGTRVVVAVKLGPREIGRAEKVDGELRITKRIDDDAGRPSRSGRVRDRFDGGRSGASWGSGLRRTP